MRQEFHREQQRDRGPAGHQYRLPRQCRRGRDVGCQGHRDAEQEGQPYEVVCVVCAGAGLSEQGGCRQEEEAVHRQGPQGCADGVCAAL